MRENPAKHITPLEVEHWPRALDGIVADMNGTPINVHQLMAHSPDLLAAWWNFRNHAVAGGSLGPHLGELVILRVAVHLGAWYEWASHVDRAQKNGMATQTIFETLRAQPDLPKSENLVLTAVDELMADRGIRPSTRAQLEKHYSTAQIMDVIAIQGMYVILGGFIKTWDLALDDTVAHRIEAVTNRADFERAAAEFRRAIQNP